VYVCVCLFEMLFLITSAASLSLSLSLFWQSDYFIMSMLTMMLLFGFHRYVLFRAGGVVLISGHELNDAPTQIK
jgi:hypothetical protein